MFIFSGPCQNLEDGAYDEDENFPDFVREFCDEFVEAPIHLQTMVSLSAPNIDCPFTGEFTFSYKMGKNVSKVLTSFFQHFSESVPLLKPSIIILQALVKNQTL